MKLEEIKIGNWDSSVSVVTSLRDERPKNHFDIRKGQDIFVLHLRVQTGCDVHAGSCTVGVVGSEWVELCCHYTVFVNGRVLRNSMEKCSS